MSYYSGESGGLASAQSSVGTMPGLKPVKDLHTTQTVGEHIDARIAILKGEITKLENTKKRLTDIANLLDVDLNDLRRAVNY